MRPTLPDATPPGLDAAFRHAMGSLPAAVTVVSCRFAGEHHAMTASAVTSVSMEPPMLLVCVSRAARFWPAISQSERWTVSVLAAGARPHAEWLATSGRDLRGQLDQVPHRHSPNGNAVLLDSLAVVECRTEQRVEAGDHDIVIGRVEWAEAGAGPDPLLYWRSDYRSLAD